MFYRVFLTKTKALMCSLVSSTSELLSSNASSIMSKRSLTLYSPPLFFLSISRFVIIFSNNASYLLWTSSNFFLYPRKSKFLQNQMKSETLNSPKICVTSRTKVLTPSASLSVPEHLRLNIICEIMLLDKFSNSSVTLTLSQTLDLSCRTPMNWRSSFLRTGRNWLSARLPKNSNVLNFLMNLQ